MARQKMSYVKKVMILGGIAVLIQLGILWRLKSSTQAVVSLKDYMAKIGGENQASLLTSLQIAISDYKIRKGAFPENLDTLVPDYFDVVPIDPDTSAPYAYAIVGDTYVLGAKAATKQEVIQASTTKTIVAGSQEESELLIASLTQEIESGKVYDPAGRKDPFVPYDFSPREGTSGGETPLEQIPYDAMRLSAVLLGSDQPKAIIEDGGGIGHTVTIGTKVGNTGGEIRKIEQDRITILESIIDFTGEKRTRVVELRLPKRR